jgi:hypothetical protein
LTAREPLTAAARRLDFGEQGAAPEGIEAHAPTLAALFEHCGLSGVGMDAALGAFEADSHAGTPLAQSILALPLNAEGFARVRSILQCSSLGLTGHERLTVQAAKPKGPPPWGDPLKLSARDRN